MSGTTLVSLAAVSLAVTLAVIVIAPAFDGITGVTLVVWGGTMAAVAAAGYWLTGSAVLGLFAVGCVVMVATVALVYAVGIRLERRHKDEGGLG